MSLQADVIVGADGVNSAVRSTGGFVSRVSSGINYVRTIVKGRASSWLEEYWTPLGSFGQAPLGDDLVYFSAAAQVAEAAEAVSRRDLSAFRQEWRRVLPAAADLLERVSSFDDLLINTVRRVDCGHSGHIGRSCGQRGEPGSHQPVVAALVGTGVVSGSTADAAPLSRLGVGLAHEPSDPPWWRYGRARCSRRSMTACPRMARSSRCSAGLRRWVDREVGILDGISGAASRSAGATRSTCSR
jgi:hypothetical protein